MKTIQDPKAAISTKNSIHRFAADRVTKDLVKNFDIQKKERLHYSASGMHEGKRNKSMYKQESFTRASMTAYLL